MSKKLFYQLTGEAREGVVHLSFYQSTDAFHAQSIPLDAVFTVYRKEEPDFQFGRDYEEFFDQCEYTNAQVIYEGPLELFYKRRYYYQDTEAQIGKTYSYWVTAGGKQPAFGPCPVRVRDTDVWWPYAKINAFMEQLQKDYPEWTNIRQFGVSTMKKPLIGILVGNPHAPIALVGTIHAGESGPELILPALRKLLEQDRDLLAKVGIAAFPSVNVDARERLVLGAPQYIRTNNNNVDLNRNFDADWTTVDYTYGYDTSEYGGQTYRGPYPHSEEETKALVHFMSETLPQVVFSFHCLASICDDSFYTASAAKGDAFYEKTCRRYLDLFKSGFRGKESVAELGYICNDGSFPAYVYQKYAVPCFDLEFSGDQEGKCCLTDGTTHEVMELYRERHYQGLRNLLKGLSE